MDTRQHSLNWPRLSVGSSLRSWLLGFHQLRLPSPGSNSCLQEVPVYGVPASHFAYTVTGNYRLLSRLGLLPFPCFLTTLLLPACRTPRAACIIANEILLASSYRAA